MEMERSAAVVGQMPVDETLLTWAEAESHGREVFRVSLPPCTVRFRVEGREGEEKRREEEALNKRTSQDSG